MANQANGKRKPVAGRLIIPAFLLAFAVGSCTALAGQFRASVVKIDITPDKPQWLLGYGPRQSTGVHDHLFHRIVAMDDGKTQFFLISTDICLYSPSVYDDITRELSAADGNQAPASMVERYSHAFRSRGRTARAGRSLPEGAV